jgi:GT2 family glycosyltransferase
MIAAVEFGPFTRLLGGGETALPITEDARTVDWVSGAHMLISGALLDRIGLLDESYFLYFEEADFAARAAGAGFACHQAPASRVVHIGGQSTGLTGMGASGARKPRYWFASRARFLRRQLGDKGAQSATLLWLALRPIGRLIAALRGRRLPDPPHLWRDMLRSNFGRDGLIDAPWAPPRI